MSLSMAMICVQLALRRRLLRILWAAGIGASLAACGGGGGGGTSGGGSGGNVAATLQVSTNQLTVSAMVSDPAPTGTLQASIQVTTSTSQKFYIDGRETNNGIASVGGAASSGIETVTVTFKSPATLGVGTYNDTLTIQGCYDQACTSQVTNSPQTIAVSYTVTPSQAAAPQISSLSPSSATAGQAAFVLSVNGFNFTPQSALLWNGSARPTTFVSSSMLTAQIAAADVMTAGTESVTVDNGPSNGGVSAPSSFTVGTSGAFVLTTISPKHVTAGGGNFLLSAIGSGFTAQSTVQWNGSALPTTYVSNTLLRAAVSAAQIVNAGTATLSVLNASMASSSATLTIDPPTVDAVSYQMNPAHTGYIKFNNLILPSGSSWSTDVGGTPSYALIVNGTVYVTVAVGNDSQLIALNASTGAKVWGPIALAGFVNAAYDEGRLFVASGSTTSQIITTLDPATGNAIWSATVPGSWFTEPPVAAAGIVYTTNGGVVTAFDETSGVILWSQDIGGTDGVVAVTPDGLYGASPCTAVDLEPTLGVLLWNNNSGCSGGGGATPVVTNGVLYSPDNSAGSSGTIFDAETGSVKGTYAASVIPAFSPTTGFFLNSGTLQGVTQSNNTVLWSFAGDGLLVTAPVAVNNYVFIGSSSGNLYGLDATTGQAVFTQNLGAAIPATNEYAIVIYSGLAAGDGILVVPNGTQVTAFRLSTAP